MKIAPDNLQPKTFAFSPENLEKAEQILARYPEGKQASALIPLLDLAQRQHQGWLPRAAMETVGKMLSMPLMRVLEVASFYTMFNLEPVGEYLVQVCTTTPCWLRGSDGLIGVCHDHLRIGNNETTPNGMFTLKEVECLGACANAPMVQINDDYYEDLDPASFEALLDALAGGARTKPGSVRKRKASEPAAIDETPYSIEVFYGPETTQAPKPSPAPPNKEKKPSKPRVIPLPKASASKQPPQKKEGD